MSVCVAAGQWIVSTRELLDSVRRSRSRAEPVVPVVGGRCGGEAAWRAMPSTRIWEDKGEREREGEGRVRWTDGGKSKEYRRRTKDVGGRYLWYLDCWRAAVGRQWKCSGLSSVSAGRTQMSRGARATGRPWTRVPLIARDSTHDFAIPQSNR